MEEIEVITVSKSVMNPASNLPEEYFVIINELFPSKTELPGFLWQDMIKAYQKTLLPNINFSDDIILRALCYVYNTNVVLRHKKGSHIFTRTKTPTMYELNGKVTLTASNQSVNVHSAIVDGYEFKDIKELYYFIAESIAMAQTKIHPDVKTTQIGATVSLSDLVMPTPITMSILDNIFEDINFKVPKLYRIESYMEYVTALGIVSLYMNKAIGNDKKYEEVLEYFNIKAKIKAIADRMQIAIEKEQYLLQQFMIIIANKFGNQRLNTIMETLKNYYLNKTTLLGQLKDSERTAVINTQKLFSANTLAMLNNRCGHKAALRDVIKFEKTIAPLEPYLPKSGTNANADAYITCENCGFNLICPHLLFKIKNNRLKYQDILLQLIEKFADRNANAKIQLQYYCKICGEKLNDVEFENIVQSKELGFNEINPDVRAQAWIAAMRFQNFIKTPYMYDQKVLANKVCNEIYPFIFEQKFSSINETIAHCIIAIYACFYHILTGKNIYKYKPEPNITPQQLAIVLVNNIIAIYNNSYVTQSVEEIKTLFTYYYKKLAGFTIESRNYEDDIIESFAQCNPIYGLARTVLILMRKINSKMSEEDIFDVIMGGSPKELLNDNNINLFHKLYELPAQMAQANHLFTSYTYLSKYLRSGVWDEKLEKSLHQGAARMIYKAYQTKLTYYTYVPSPISNLYDINGIRHKWDLFEYDSSPTPITRAELLKMDQSPGKFVAMICGTCGQKYGAAAPPDDVLAEIAEKVDMMNNKKMFYIYYQERCPKGEIHTFGKDNKCSKCGFNNKEDDTYYKTYVETYKKDNKKILDIKAAMASSDIKLDALTDTKPPPAVLPDFEFVMNDITKMAKLCGVNINEILSIGLTEGKKLTEIKSGALVVEKVEMGIHDPRIYQLSSYYLMCMSNYEQHPTKKELPHMPEYKCTNETRQQYFIWRLCRLIVAFIDAISQEFAIDMMNKVLSISRLLMKVERFDWKVGDVGADETQAVAGV